jgi:hypothetical protein
MARKKKDLPKHGPLSGTRIDEIVVDARHRGLDRRHTEGLAESMGTIGMQQPIVIAVVCAEDGKTWRPQLVSGLHRLEAAKLLGWTYVPTIEREDASNVVDFHEGRVDRSCWTGHATRVAYEGVA